MRILQVGKFYHPYRGGIETVLKSLCDGLCDLGHDVRCLVANTRPVSSTEVIDGVKVLRVASFGTISSVSIAPQFPFVLRALARQADVLHIHQQNPLADLAVLLTRPKVPLVVTCHSGIVRQRIGRSLWNPVLAAVWRRATQVVVASPPLAKALGCKKPGGCAVIPFGIDVERISNREHGRFRIEETTPLILSVGRMVSYKGFEYLIDALARLPVGRMVLVGDGPLKDSLRKRAERLGVAGRVEFTGLVSADRLADLYRRCAIFVLPSVTAAEAFGLVQLEAMAYGKPVVSTDLPTGVPWVNRDGETGYVVKPRSVEDLTRALTRLLEDSELRRQMGVAGRRRVEEEFTARQMVARYADLYSGL